VSSVSATRASCFVRIWAQAIPPHIDYVGPQWDFLPPPVDRGGQFMRAQFDRVRPVENHYRSLAVQLVDRGITSLQGGTRAFRDVYIFRCVYSRMPDGGGAAKRRAVEQGGGGGVFAWRRSCGICGAQPILWRRFGVSGRWGQQFPSRAVDKGAGHLYHFCVSGRVCGRLAQLVRAHA
jgi:hypothetical protein